MGNLEFLVRRRVEEALDQPPLVKMLLDYLRNVVDGHPAVEGAFGVDHHYGSHFAHPVTPGLDQGHFLVEISSFYLLLESFENGRRAAGGAAGPLADQHVGTIKSHFLQAP